MSAADHDDTLAFSRVTPGDLGRWAAALVLVAGVGTAAGVALQRYTPPAMPAATAEPAILLDLAPPPMVQQAEPEAAPEVIPEQTATPLETLAPEAIEPETLEPEAIAPEPIEPETMAPDVITPELLTPEPVAQEALAPEPVEPETIEPEPLAEAAPQAIEPIVQPVEPEPLEEAPAEPLQPESVQPEQTQEPALEPEVEPTDMPVPVTMSADIRERREETPRTPRPQPPPRQQTAEPAPERPRTQPQAQPAAQQQAPAASSVSPEQWQSQVLRQLDRRKVYPRDARQRGEEGSVLITFSVNASGGISNVGVARSSGFPALDQAAIETARQASPLPAPPANLAGQSLSATIRFTLR